MARALPVILIGGTTQHRAIDRRTTEIAQRLGERASRQSTMTGGAVAAQATPRRGRLTGKSRTSTLSSRLLGDPRRSTPAPLVQPSRSPLSPPGIAVSALAIYEPPYFAGSDGREHIATLQRMLDEGQYDRASRYNLTAIIGLPGEAVDQMAEAPWWSGLVGVAPTLVYDRQASHDIETDPDWRARWARVTVPTVVYSGDRTFPWLPEAADAVADALSKAQRRVLVGQDHGPAPEVIVPELVRFLRSVA